MQSAPRTNGFINESFLLQNDTARQLFFDYADGLPIVDYHCHLPPDKIAGDYHFKDITEIWLQGDHYKWRAMRTLGVKEEFITGASTSEDKFAAWAKVVPLTVRNPLFHWTQMELKNPFGIDTFLNENSAAEIFHQCNQLLQSPGFSTVGLMKANKVELVGTTDDPCDSLAFHKAFAAAKTGIEMRPSFRPDAILNINHTEQFFAYKAKLEHASGIKISSIDTLLEALQNRVDYFHANGCRISDHGLTTLPIVIGDKRKLEHDFLNFLSASEPGFPPPHGFDTFILLELCKMYHAKGWVQQFHLGAIRNVNSRLRKSLGADCGVDSIGDYPQAEAMAKFFDALDSEDKLAKTIIYNLIPAYNEVFASMTGNFNDGTIKGKMQFGSAWWFLDQKDGIEKQLNALSNLGVLSTFVGMTTDSRSFLSYSRHDYFRRILCNLIGTEMEEGLLPNDTKWLGEIISKICYHNAKEYFGLGV